MDIIDKINILQFFTASALTGVCANTELTHMPDEKIGNLAVCIAKATIAALNKESEVSNG